MKGKDTCAHASKQSLHALLGETAIVLKNVSYFLENSEVISCEDYIKILTSVEDQTYLLCERERGKGLGKSTWTSGNTNGPLQGDACEFKIRRVTVTECLFLYSHFRGLP